MAFLCVCMEDGLPSSKVGRFGPAQVAIPADTLGTAACACGSARAPARNASTCAIRRRAATNSVLFFATPAAAAAAAATPRAKVTLSPAPGRPVMGPGTPDGLRLPRSNGAWVRVSAGTSKGGRAPLNQGLWGVCWRRPASCESLSRAGAAAAAVAAHRAASTAATRVGAWRWWWWRLRRIRDDACRVCRAVCRAACVLLAGGRPENESERKPRFVKANKK